VVAPQMETRKTSNEERMKVAVVILNFNGKKFLEEFLPNVIANCDPTLAEVVVADNASTDDSVAFMKERFP